MENKHIITEQGRRLLKSWGYGVEFEKREKIAERAAAAVMHKLQFIHGRRESSAEKTFGLPYTSSGDFAAVWNCNAEAMKTQDGARLFFEGVAIDEAENAVLIWTERNADGDEIGTRYETIKRA